MLIPNCLRLDMHLSFFPFSLAAPRLGMSSAARIEIIAMTTKSSIKVNFFIYKHLNFNIECTLSSLWILSIKLNKLMPRDFPSAPHYNKIYFWLFKLIYR